MCKKKLLKEKLRKHRDKQNESRQRAPVVEVNFGFQNSHSVYLLSSVIFQYNTQPSQYPNIASHHPVFFETIKADANPSNTVGQFYYFLLAKDVPTVHCHPVGACVYLI